MAATVSALFAFLCIFSSSVLESASEQVLPRTDPHLTGCLSSEMETFHCRWTTGASPELSEPGNLRLFYTKKRTSTPEEWTECPHYSADQPNKCFFDRNHTSIWTIYGVQLRSKDEAILYDEDFFNVEDIVRPDPPVSLNWTLLNISVTGAYYDIMLNWRPPESAGVEIGWMTLEYEVQYRDVSSDLWEVTKAVKSTHRSLYGLETNVNHEVRVRCKMLHMKEFGVFSESVFIHIPSKVSRFPVGALLLFGALSLVAILMLVVISQQEKLMVILLPPVPGPKIRGIDPNLLKKGKLRELTSILGGPPDLRPELYNKDPWVEFIDLDIEEQNETLTDLDTHCLMHRSQSPCGTPLSIGFRDDDSGRASCCDPDLPSDQEASPFHPLIPTQSLNKEIPCPTDSQPSSPVQSLVTQSPFATENRDALYTLVSEVKPSGKVLLSPEEQSEVKKTTSKDTEKDLMAEKEKEKKEFQLLEVTQNHGGYTSELNAGRTSPRSSIGDISESCQTAEDLSSSPSPKPCHESDTSDLSLLPHAPTYTVVEGVDRQNGLLLTPNSIPAPHLIIPKTMTPDGYLTPDLLGSVTP